MDLLVISHTEHYRDGSRLLGWAPTVREIDSLATLFHHVTHLAWVVKGNPPRSTKAYEARNVSLKTLPASGGQGVAEKARILRSIPQYLKAIVDETRRVDCVHVRCPASISLVALAWLSLVSRPQRRWIKYGGNWEGYKGEPLSYRLQRWWLRRNLANCNVTINGDWPSQSAHVRTLPNPCLNDIELHVGRECATSKHVDHGVRILFAGRVDSNKGADRVIRAAQALASGDFPVHLDIAGDGPTLDRSRQLVDTFGLQQSVEFHGWLDRERLIGLLKKAHFVALPSRTEGWPKILSEGMAFGAIPLSSNVSGIPKFLSKVRAGWCSRPDDFAGMARAIRQYVENPESWREESLRCVDAAVQFSYQAYLEGVSEMMDLPAHEAGTV